LKIARCGGCVKEVGHIGPSANSLFKRSIVGAYHQVSAKHLPAYLDEFEFRFDNRNNPYLFRDTLLRLIGSESLTYKDLVA